MAINCVDEEYYTSEQFRLRAGTPMPIEGVGNFKYHTFLAEKYEIRNYVAIRELPASTEFRGQGGGLYSASFSRMQDNTGQIFSGKKVYNPTIVDEDAYSY